MFNTKLRDVSFFVFFFWQEENYLGHIDFSQVICLC